MSSVTCDGKPYDPNCPRCRARRVSRLDGILWVVGLFGMMAALLNACAR